MPIYEYRCAKCSAVFEELIFGDRDRKIPCPECGADATEKIPSVIGGIAMRGSSAPACGSSSCASASACAASGGGCCPHAN
jgi:putative FmdB family regulatory protein